MLFRSNTHPPAVLRARRPLIAAGSGWTSPAAVFKKDVVAGKACVLVVDAFLAVCITDLRASFHGHPPSIRFWAEVRLLRTVLWSRPWDCQAPETFVVSHPKCPAQSAPTLPLMALHRFDAKFFPPFQRQEAPE